MSKVQGCMTAFHAVPVTSVLIKLGMVQGSTKGKTILLSHLCVPVLRERRPSIAGDRMLPL